MSIHTFKADIRTSQELIEEIYETIGKRFPCSLQITPEGRVLSFEFEDEWKEGSTKAVEKTNDEGETFIDYEEDYTQKKLTIPEKKKVEDWATALIDQS